MFGFNPWMLALIAIVLLGAFGGVALKSYSAGASHEKNKCNNQKQETINENIDTRKKQDEVIRPSDRAYIDSLRSGTF